MRVSFVVVMRSLNLKSTAAAGLLEDPPKKLMIVPSSLFFIGIQIAGEAKMGPGRNNCKKTHSRVVVNWAECDQFNSSHHITLEILT